MAILFVAAWCVDAWLPATSYAQGSPGAPSFSAEEQAAIARAFAPVFVFHPEEQFFPISSMSPLFVEDASADADDDGDAGSPLANHAERAARYAALSQQAKLALSAVGYRVSSRFRHGRTEVIVEYWCHYVYNAFTIRGTWFPYRISGDHAQDLERLFLVLAPAPGAPPRAGAPDEHWARGAFDIQRVVANAHDGSVPPNEYDAARGHRLQPPLTILVERGSHAMAPDINHDGRFTPGVDSTSTSKLLWGIRDDGDTWGWYRRSYMETRDPARAVRLCPHHDSYGRAGIECSPYALLPIDDFQRWFDSLQLSPEDRREIVGRASWFARTLGDVRLEELMVPSDPADGSMLDRMLQRRTRASQGLLAGFATLGDRPGFAVGRHYYGDIQSRKWPDVVAEAAVLVPHGERPALKGLLLGSYPIDAITHVVVGVDWISSARPFVDIVAGGEIRIGLLHVRPSWRLREGVFDSAVMVVF